MTEWNETKELPVETAPSGPYAYGNCIAVEPLPETTVRTQTASAFVSAKRSELIRLEVVFQKSPLPEDQFDFLRKHIKAIFIKSDRKDFPWTKEVFTLNDKKFILAPLDQIILVEFDTKLYHYE